VAVIAPARRDADPSAMLAALRAGDHPAALEAALDAYFGSPLRSKPKDVPSSLATLFSRFAPGLIRQNRLALPSRESRVFYIENQSCNEWALGDATDDPTVVRDGSVAEHERLAGFAVQLVLFEASMGALDWRAGGPTAMAGRVLSPLGEVPLRPWTWPNATRFYVAPGIVAHADRVADDETWVFASATAEQQLLDLARLNGIEWTGVESAAHGA
jgi:hypothetical protein